MLTCMGAMFRSHGLMGMAFKLAVTAGFYLLVIQNIARIGEGIMESAVRYGLIAGGSGMSADAFLRSPDTLFLLRYAKANDLFELADMACQQSSFGCLGNMGSWLPVQAAAWAVFLTFALVGFLVFATAMLFKLALLAGVLLLPLAMFQPTAQLGWMPIRAVVHFSVQLMVLALVTAVATLIFTKITVSADPGLSSARPFILASVVFLGMVLGATRLAYALTSGAMLQAGALFAAPAGMAVTAGRSAAGHLDAPVSAAAARSRAAIQAVIARSPDLARSAVNTVKSNLGKGPKS